MEAADREPLAKHANNPKVAANLRDGFPSPYTLEDADRFIALAGTRSPRTFFAIEVDGEAAGGIGLVLHGDVEGCLPSLGTGSPSPTGTRA